VLFLKTAVEDGTDALEFEYKDGALLVVALLRRRTSWR
jgi:hypothetical protein